MSDYSPPPGRDDLRFAVRRQLETIEPGLRVVAEDLLADVSTIDLVAVDVHGRAVLVLIADDGEDLETFTRALAARAWVSPRVRDWAQLAPELELRPDAGVRAILVSPGFDPDTTAAALSLGSEGLELALYKLAGGDLGASSQMQLMTSRNENPVSDRAPRPPSEPSVFRSGLSEEELGLSPEEIREFD